MKATFIEKENNNIKFTITFDAAEFDAATDKAYKQIRKNITIDGFRKGKAPRKMIENMYGEGIFVEEALNDLLEKNYSAALDEVGADVIAQPSIELGEVKKGEDVVVTVTVECFPEVEVKNYKGLEIEKAETVIGDDEINAELEKVQKKQARMETVEGRAAQDGDSVIIDFKGTIDGEEFKGGSAENFELKLGSGQFIPGFEEQLIGKNTGDEVNVEVTFPEDYHSEELAGKPAVFATKIHEIKVEILPEIDDELASDVSDYETLDEYKKHLAETLQEQANNRDESIMKDRALEKLYTENELEAPAAMVRSELDNMMADMTQSLRYQGITMEQYQQWVGKTSAEMIEESRPEAIRRVNTRILLKNIIRMEGLKATEEEVAAEVAEFAKQYGQTAEQVIESVGKENLKCFEEDVLTKKAIELVYNEAKKN